MIRGMNPIDLQGQVSKVKVIRGKFRNNLVGRDQIVECILINLAQLLPMLRGYSFVRSEVKVTSKCQIAR